ncbi:MAG: hypothetical protein Q7U04_06485 [Bacteriovorax sp.]|nr:hypothetical protein [Bacteriovorax sp.]
MSEQQKWKQFLSSIESMAPNLTSIEEQKLLLNQYESIDENYRDIECPSSYKHMWKVSLQLGKLNLANKYAQKYLQHLLDLKRTPQIKSFLASLLEASLFKKDEVKYLRITEILLGSVKKITEADLVHFELLNTHPDHWKASSLFLQQYLLLESDWKAEEWKLCYQYILLNHFDRDIFNLLLEKSQELKNKNTEKKIKELFDAKNIKYNSQKLTGQNIEQTKKESLNLDYDQVAMDMLSGLKEPDNEEQRRVLNSLRFIPEEDLALKGQDMIVAFELLGMEQVVQVLCEKMVKILTDVKQKASVYYVWIQALNNNEEYFKSIDLIDEILEKEPLYGEERLAFLYLKAEACLKLKKIKLAKQLYMEIKKENPHYRLVGARLKLIEAT